MGLAFIIIVTFRTARDRDADDAGRCVMSAYFHGGFPGLSVGDWIEAPDVTAATNTLSRYASMTAPHGTRTDVVYVTTVQDHARAFAALYPDGALYRVEPEGVVGPDPDAPDVSTMCRRARVVEVVRPRIVFAHRRPEAWFRMLAGPRRPA